MTESHSPLSPHEVAVIVLNYNGTLDTLACLAALGVASSPPGWLVVVDNASSPEDVACLEAGLYGSQKVPADQAMVQLVKLTENNGYASGNNAGIRLALQNPACRAVWVLNNDTEPEPEALLALCAGLNARPEAGMAGSTLVYAHARDTVQCAGGFSFNPWLGTTPPVQGGASARTVRALTAGQAEECLDYLSGASILVRREVIERIGCIPEDYFLYYEDTAWGLLARQAGYALTWVPGSVVYHKEGGATGASSAVGTRGFNRSALIDYLCLRNRLHVVRQFAPHALPTALFGTGGVLLKRIARGQIERLPLLCRAVWAGLTGRMGKPLAMIETTPRCRVLLLTVRADFGGGPEHVLQLLRHAPHDLDVYVACPPDYPYYDRYCELLGADRVMLLPHRRFRFSALWALRTFCKRHHVTVLHSHGKGAGVYSRLLAFMTGLPCIHTFHGVHVATYGVWKKHLYALFERLMARCTLAGIAVSEGERQALVQHALMPQHQIRLIPNGVIIPTIPAPPPSKAPWVVVSFSRFDYQKNSLFVLDILEALRKADRLHDVHCLLVGDGSGLAALLHEADARGLGQHVRSVGSTPTPHEAFNGALCYLSTSRWEGLPLAVLEAMAHGLPAVVTDVVGNRDAVRHNESGFLYPEADAAAAADALLRLADDTDLRTRLSLTARTQVAAAHDVREMARQTAAMWREAHNTRRDS